MANPRKAAPARPGSPRDSTAKKKSAGSAATKSAANVTPDAAADTATRSKAAPAKKATPAKPTPAKTPTKDAGASRRFGDGATAGARKGAAGPPAKKGGGGGRGGRTRPAPPVRVAQPKPWGMIAATVAVVLFAGAAIGYAVVQANSVALPEDPGDIEGISVLEYAAGQEHVTTEVTYTETPPVGGPHDFVWADCDGAIYDQQIRSENAVHSLEHGAVWITYNPDDISDEELAVLSGYAQNESYTMLSPFAGLSSPVSLQSWNHQLFVDAVDDPRITVFIQTLRQNPEEYPEVGASCNQPAFLSDPLIEGEPSRMPQGDVPVVTDAPSTP